ncbi:radical SAM protein [Pseudomonas sp. MLB6B]
MKLIDNGVIKFDYQFPLYNFFFPSQTAHSFSADNINAAEIFASASRHSTSRALYFHIPFCEKICSFCPFTKGLYKNQEQIDAYTKALIKEIELKSKIMDLNSAPIKAVFFGGGTPSLLSPANIRSIRKALHDNFDLSEVSEFSFEFSTTSVNTETVLATAELGVTHARFGLQTIHKEWRNLFNLDPEINRIEKSSQLLNSQFDHVLCDILYGMNGSTEEQTLIDIDYAVALGVSNIDIYPINNVATSVKLHKALRSRTPDVTPALRKLNMKLLFDEHLRSKGYVPYNGHGYRLAPSQTSLPYVKDYRFIYHDHLYGYADLDLLGFGTGAISALHGAVITNTSSRERYCSELMSDNYSCRISLHDPVLSEARPLIMGLPYHGNVSKAHINFHKIPDALMARLRSLISAGLITETKTTYSLTHLGWLWYSNLMFYLMPQSEQEHFKNLVFQRLSTPGRVITESELIYRKIL